MAAGKKNGEGKEGKFLEKENIFFPEGKEKEEYISRRKIYGERRRRTKRRNHLERENQR